MYNAKDIVFTGKHDYDKESAEKFAAWGGKSFSIGIFRWGMKSSKKEMKRSAVKVRIHSSPDKKEKAFEMAENVVKLLDSGQWDGRKTVSV